METTETLEISVDIMDPIGFHANPNMLEMRLKNDLVGKCKNAYYVLGVKEIVKSSPCTINFLDSRSNGSVSAVVRVQALRYFVGDVVAGCTVMQKDNSGKIFCSKQMLLITIANGPYNSSMPVGATAIVRITAIHFAPNSSTIAALGELFMFSPTLTVFRVRAEDVDEAIIAPIRTAAQEEFTARNPQYCKIFANAWATPQSLPEGAKQVNLFELPTTGEFLVAADNRLDLTSGALAIYSNIPEGAIPRDCESATMAMYNLYGGFRNMLAAIRDIEEEFKKNPSNPPCKSALIVIARSKLK